MSVKELVHSAWHLLRARLSLSADKASDESIDRDIRAGVEMRGTNLWVLMLAILIASVGLNINSGAVIIGAMLISPLMGPIIGAGYGVGILDTQLIRRSLTNLGVSVFISLLTSTVYFSLSPLTAADSELIARTSPTLWDLLVAFFGGLAGIIAITRKEKSNVLPGVAIATALMPPLCTTGFGLAHSDWSTVGGAFFLFLMNGVFIAFSASLMVRAFHVKKTSYLDRNKANTIRRYVLAIVIATVIPSAYMAYRLVDNEVFKARAKQFAEHELATAATQVIDVKALPAEKKIEATLIGQYLGKDVLDHAASRLEAYGLSATRLVVHQANQERIDVTTLKSSLVSDLYSQSQQLLAEKERRIAILESELGQVKNSAQHPEQLSAEIKLLFPSLRELVISEVAAPAQAAPAPSQRTMVVNAQGHLSSRDKQRLLTWLQARSGYEQVHLFVR